MYEEVTNQKCHFCEKVISGNPNYMLGGKGWMMDGRRKPKWLKEKPEFQWAWNGLSDTINGECVGFHFYLCPEHQKKSDYSKAFKWAQDEINKTKSPRHKNKV